jgi:SAM-dependent methyltransferase
MVMETNNAIAPAEKAAAQVVRSRSEPFGLRSVLALPIAYRMLHGIFGTHRLRRYYVDEFVKVEPGCRVVDIGCGTADMIEYLPAVEYIGVDFNEHYIENNRRRFPNAEFHVAHVSTELKQLLPRADLVFANALLHHLNDTEADALFASAKQLIRNDGRLCTWDICTVQGQSPISRLLIANDRGKYVRSREGYEQLAAPHFRDVRCEMSSSLLNVPYNIVMFEFRTPKV